MNWIVPAILAVAIATALGLAWFLGLDPVQGQPALAGTRPAPVPGAGAERDLVDVERLADANLEPGREALRAVPAAAGPAATDPGPVLEPPLASGQLVRVLRGRGDERVPFAVVTCSAHSIDDSATRLLRMALGDNVSGGIEPDDRNYRADEEGEVLVPVLQTSLDVRCEHEGAWGSTRLPAGRRAEVSELRLFPDASLRVRVVRALERTPVEGAAVAIRYETGPGDSETLATRWTGTDGEVSFDRVRQYSRYYWPRTEELAVHLAGIYADDIHERFEPDDPSELVELELPPSTTLEVLVHDASGRPSERPVVVRVARAGETAFEDAGRTVATVTEEGRAVFAQIGSGLELAVQVESFEAVTADPVVVRSASEAGGRTTVHVALGDARPVLVGRVLDEDGAPLADVGLGLWLTDGETRAVRDSRTRTDAGGSFRYPVPDRMAQLEQLTLSISSGTSREPVQLTELRLAGPLPPGEVQLGELRLEGRDPLLSGWVRDSEGRGIEGALVRVMPTPYARSNPSIPSAVAGEGGAFAVFGPRVTTTLVASASHPGHSYGRGTIVAAGATDVELVLDGAGRIAGSIVFDEEWLCDFAAVGAYRGDDTNDQYGESPARPGYFVLDSLPPGTWTVLVGMEGDLEHGVVVEDVEVVAGTTTRDPRLQDVDLRGKVRIVGFEVVDVDGNPVEKGEIRHRRPGAPAWSGEGWFANGKADVYTLLEELDLFVIADGMRGETVPHAEPGQRITLRPGLAARFAWSEKPPQASPGKNVTVRLISRTDEFPGREVRLSVEGSNVVIPWPGEYDVVYLFHEQVGKRWETTRHEHGALRVLDTSGAQEFTLTLPDDARAFLTSPSRAE